MRARDHGIVVGEGTPGPLNATTHVPGVRVGHTTIISGSGALVVGEGPVRTGVTVVLPPGDVWTQPVFAGAHRLNGNGEMTGLEWVRDSGMLTSPVALTNTHSVGVVRDAMLADMVSTRETTAWTASRAASARHPGSVVEATEEAIVNAPVAAETMEGRDGIVARGLDGDRLAALLEEQRQG